MTQPLCVDLFCGLGGWTEGFLSEGWRVVGFDIEQHVYGEERYPAQLVLQDVRTIHGKQFKDADMIVASSPCQAYSYMGMPWKRAKQIRAALRGDGTFPDGYRGPRTVAELNELFEQPARIQREACEAAGRYIPMVQENVKAAQPWVGRAPWHYGSYYLWGDVPALMPITARSPKQNREVLNKGGHNIILPQVANRERQTKNTGGSWFNIGSPGQKLTNRNPVHDGMKLGDRNAHRASGGALKSARFPNPDEQPTASDGVKSPGGGKEGWFGSNPPPMRRHSSKSSARKAASARIAKIPFPLAQYIAYTFHPDRARAA